MLRLTALFVLLLAAAWPAVAAKRALVIGNDSYRHVTPLTNARADARSMQRALDAAGYAVSLHEDLGQNALKDALRVFKNQVQGGDQVVVYFSGHGVQVGATNYLLPVDVRDQEEDQVKDDSMPLWKVLADLNERKPALTLAIIDACRNNPFEGKGKALGGKGLAATSAATGQMVIYAAGADQKALDRLSKDDPVRNGLFTRVLVREMETPGVPVDRVLKNVRKEVARLARSVGHEQVPAIYDQVEGDFYFRPPADGKPEPVQPVVVQQFTAIKFADLPLALAVKQVRGDGKRVLATFEDPNCGYCKKMAREIAKLDNVTIYTFLYPILSPDSLEKSNQIWCAADKAKAWNEWMIDGKAPGGKGDCDTTAVKKSVETGRKLAINGTPTIFFADGGSIPGAVPLAQIEQKLTQAHSPAR